MTTEEEQAKAAESSTEATADQDANTADSSDAEPASDANAGGEDSREDLLSVITDVTTESEKPDGEAEPADDSSTSDSEAEDASEEEDSGGSDDEEGEDGESGESEEDSGEEDDPEKPPPFHDHPRWKEMVAERDRLKQLKEPAENYQRLTEYMESNRLTPEEVAEGFQIMALMKNDPANARQILEQKMQGLQQFDPNYMPPDLQQEVDSGAITPERAQEMAQLRAQGNMSQFQAQQAKQQAEHERQQGQTLRQQQQGQQLANAVNQWENELQSKDADYAQKAPWVRDRLRALMQEKGKPQDPDSAVQLAQQAYKDVNERLKPLSKQNKRPSKPTPSGGSSKTNKEPTTLDEAIDQAIGG